MAKIFADSNFFIALFNPPDTLHALAITFARKIKEGREEVYISNLVFSETVTVLSQRVGRHVAVEVGEELLNSGNYNLIYIDEGLHNHAWGIFKQIKKKNMSFVDCSHLSAMEFEGIEQLLTFDIEDFSSLRRTYDFSFY